MLNFTFLVVTTLLYPPFISANGNTLHSLKIKQPVAIKAANGVTPEVMTSPNGRCIMRLSEPLGANETFELLQHESLQIVSVHPVSYPPQEGKFKGSTDPARQFHNLVFNLRNRTGKDLNMVCDNVSEAELKNPSLAIALVFGNNMQTSSLALNYPSNSDRKPAVVPRLTNQLPAPDRSLFSPASFSDRVGIGQ